VKSTAASIRRESRISNPLGKQGWLQGVWQEGIMGDYRRLPGLATAANMIKMELPSLFLLHRC
jgi:hypothetical protein